jgi:hypothetical protein
MLFTVLLGVVAALFILNRQRHIRPVPRVLGLRFPIVLGVLGLINLLGYADTHHPSQGAYLWVLATLVVGGVLLGAVRALTVKIWTSNDWVVRQGTALTMGLWLVSLALHFVSAVGGTNAGNFEASSFLLYLGLTYGVQNYVVHRRATPMWDALGPEAGQRIKIDFGQGPGAFFTTFGGRGPGFGPGPGSGPGPGFGAGAAAGTHPWRNDPSVIDVEVVDDDEEPPELR